MKNWRINLYPVECAMHGAIDVRTPWGYLCFHWTTRAFGGYWPWYLYWSPDATPTKASWGIGPGFQRYI